MSQFVEKLNSKWQEFLDEDKLLLLTLSGDETIIQKLGKIQFVSAGIYYRFEGEPNTLLYKIIEFRVGCRFEEKEFELVSLESECLYPMWKDGTDSVQSWYVHGILDWDDYAEAKYALLEYINLQGILNFTHEQESFFKNLLSDVGQENTIRKTADFDLHQFFEEELQRYLEEKIEQKRQYWKNILKEDNDIDIGITDAGWLLTINKEPHVLLAGSFMVQL